jgi:hypothetical protein
MEFRDPRLDQAPSAERIAKEFRFDSSMGKVEDVTEAALNMLKARASQPPAGQQGTPGK